ncbi:hypothetical protein TCE0_044f16307 [Talaromyces pinophilus]|uniref:Uncharacterized protein n=1 Tax=Talaromyces pinophilus TaxID=128442 RepID=A0A478EBQ3_TALPI|nr:hypothetical protein TCE0_044f16307 [Talaromyces pinophilus]
MWEVITLTLHPRSFPLTPTDRAAFSIGTIRTVLKDVIPPVGPEEVRYEIENEQTHTKTAIYEENIAGLSR